MGTWLQAAPLPRCVCNTARCPKAAFRHLRQLFIIFKTWVGGKLGEGLVIQRQSVLKLLSVL